MHYVIGVVLDSHEESVEEVMERYGAHNDRYETHTISYVLKQIRDTFQRSVTLYTEGFEKYKAEYLALDPTDANKSVVKERMDMYQGWVDECQEVLDYSDEQMITWLEEEAPYIDDLGNIDEVDVENDTVIVNIGNPEAQWDWYVIGGRWRGRVLPCKPDADPETLIRGSGGVFDKGEPRDFPDGCYIKDLSFEALLNMKKADIERAKATDESEFVFGPDDGRPEYWADLRKNNRKQFGIEAKAHYIKTLEDGLKGLNFKDHFTNNIYAYIDLDGEWNLDKNFYEYISKHPDAYVVIVDIHF